MVDLLTVYGVCLQKAANLFLAGGRKRNPEHWFRVSFFLEFIYLCSPKLRIPLGRKTSL